MSSFKNLWKFLVVLFGAFGFSTVFSSCSKEKTCVCSYDQQSEIEITTKGSCDDLEFTYDGSAINNLSCAEE